MVIKYLHLYTFVYLVFISKVNITNGLGYIRYNKSKLQCIPVESCGPGYTIKQCNTPFGHDECVECPSGQKQPYFIYAMQYRSKEGLKTLYKPEDTSCFTPVSQCLDEELQYQRHAKESFCDTLSGCKCRTSKCFYGDPCLCKSKKTCRENQTLNDFGECVQCDECFEKPNNGCGPCTPVKGCTIQLHSGAKTDSLNTLSTYYPESNTRKTDLVTHIVQNTSTESVNFKSETESAITQHDQTFGKVFVVIALSGFVCILIIVTTILIIRHQKRETTCQIFNAIDHGRKGQTSFTENGRITTSPTDHDECPSTIDEDLYISHKLSSCCQNTQRNSANFDTHNKQKPDDRNENSDTTNGCQQDASFELEKAHLLDNLTATEMFKCDATELIENGLQPTAPGIQGIGDTDLSSGYYLSMK